MDHLRSSRARSSRSFSPLVGTCVLLGLLAALLDVPLARAFVRFAAPAPLGGLAVGADFAVGDVDRDGDLDLLVVDAAGQQLRWLRSDGAEPPVFTAMPGLAGSGGAAGAALADVDRDGRLDAVAWHGAAGQGQLAWFRQGSDGQFTAHDVSPLSPPRSYGEGGGIAVVDLDRDGDRDVVVVDGQGLAWYENDGAQAFTLRPLPAFAGPGRVVPRDFDRDGDLDIAYGYPFGAGYLLNFGGESFGVRSLFGKRSVAMADVDRDGARDLVSLDFDTQVLSWFGSGVSGHPIPASPSNDVAAGDLDADGDLDLVGCGAAPFWAEQMTAGVSRVRPLAATVGGERSRWRTSIATATSTCCRRPPPTPAVRWCGTRTWRASDGCRTAA